MKRMNMTVLILSLLTSFTAHSAVRYWNDEFFNPQTSTEAQFWGKISTYSQWKNSNNSQIVEIDPHPQYTAQAYGHPAISSSSLTADEVQSALGSPVAEEYNFELQNRGNAYYEYQSRADFSPQDALVFEMKISQTMNRAINPDNYSASSLVGLLQSIDAPHSHIQISSDFANRVLEPIHSGHRVIQDAQNQDSAIVFSSIRVGEYNCNTLNNLIATMSEWQGESVMEKGGKKVINIFSINVLKKISGNELDKFSPLFGRRPDMVLSQEMIYVTRFVKDMANYWAFFNNPDGTTQVISYTLVATSVQFKHALDVVLNGPTTAGVASAAKSATGEKIAEGAGQAVQAAEDALNSLFGDGAKKEKSTKEVKGYPKLISEDLADLNASESPSSCKTGLALGLPFYTQKLFNGVINQL